MITVSHITKKYNDKLVLNDISFEVPSGKIYGFLGPNGAGKTTTMKILTGYILPTSGEAFINGYLAGSIEAKFNIGYLPENNPLYNDMTVYEYLRWIASVYNVKNKNNAINNVLDLCGILDKKHVLIQYLSKGYKQRVGLAASIIHNPKVLILDEPTTGLDPLQIIEIRKLIKELGKSHTVLLSTHIMQEVEALCDEVIIINKGKIIVQGTPQQLSKGINNTLRIKLEGNTIDLIDKIQQIDIVEKIIEIHKDGSIKIYEIVLNKFVDDHVIKRDIYQIIKSHDVILHEFTTKEIDMEKIFINLVNN